jgi:hypothetical protein
MSNFRIRQATGKREAAERNVVELEVKNDVFTEFENTCHKQWFYFKASFSKPLEEAKRVSYHILNAGDCAFPEAWPNTTVCYSYDRQDWRR